MIGLFIIGISYLIIITVLIVIASSTKNIKTRLVIIPAVILYTTVVYLAFGWLMGYPTTQELPDNAIINAYKIIEPSPDSSGGIYLWVTPPKQIENKNYIPRSYKITYSKKFHKQITRRLTGNQFLVFKKVFKKSNKRKNKYSQKGEDQLGKGGEFMIINASNIITKETHEETHP